MVSVSQALTRPKKASKARPGPKAAKPSQGCYVVPANPAVGSIPRSTDLEVSREPVDQMMLD